MSSSTAELTLILKAQNLAKGAIADVKTSIAGIGTAAQTAAGQLRGAFAGQGARLATEFGSLVTSVLSGSSWETAAVNLGATLAGGLAAAFGEQIIARLGASAAVQAIMAGVTAAWTAIGTAIGGFMAAAIPIGMAALPFLLVGALVAAIAFLVTHPEVAGEIAKVAGKIVGGIIGGLAGLAGKIIGMVVAAPGVIVDVVGGFVGNLVGWFLSIPGKLLELGGNIVSTIIGGLASLPGKVWDVVTQAFSRLDINVGPFHITGHGVTIDLPRIDPPANSGSGYTVGRYGGIPGKASGGWVGLHGPELTWVGERGPEYVIPNHALGGGGGGTRGVTIQGVSEQDILDMVDRGLYFRLQRSAPARS